MESLSSRNTESVEMMSVDSPTVSLREAVGNSSLAIFLIELPSRRIVELSHRAAAIFGSQSLVLRGEDILSISEQPEATTRALGVVTDGVVDGYRARRTLRSGDGTDVETTGWVRVLERTGDQASALFIVMSASTASDASDGQFTAECLVAPLLDIVHRDDVAKVLSAIDDAESNDTQVEVLARLRGEPHIWQRLRLALGPVDDEARRFGFTLAPADDSTAPIAPGERVIELEHRLRRIAREVEDAGVVTELGGRFPDPETVPGLEALTPRQREVVTRLLRGERVPEIARGMFLSASTVRNHLANLFRKVGVHSQSEFLDLVRQRD